MNSELLAPYLTTTAAVQGTALVLFGLVLAALSRSRNLQELRWWSGSWFALALFHLGDAVVLLREATHDQGSWLLLRALIQVAGWAHLVLFAGGSLRFFRGSASTRSILCASGAGAVIAVVLVLAIVGREPLFGAFARGGLRAAIASVLFLGTAVMVSRSRSPRRSLANQVFFVFLVLYGLEQAHYAIVLGGAWLGGWPITDPLLFRLVDLLLQVGLGLGMVMLVTDRLRTQSQRNAEAVMKAEEELRQTHRIEAVTTLAGGIAHDYNNILTAIVGYADLVDDDLPDGSSAKGDLEAIRSAVRRASILTQELLSFSRRQELKPERVDLHENLDRMRRAIDRSLGSAIGLQVEVGKGVGEIFVDPAYFELLMVNLAINAKEAMPDGGTMAVRVFTEDVVEGDVASGLRMKPGPAVILEVTDTGRGMDEVTRARIFEPFFTTKGEPRSAPDGLAPGMGLSACYGFVRQSGGDVVVLSRENEGTTFRIYFPSAERQQEPAIRPARTHGSETILLVEDEEPVREAVVRTLGGRGYEVLVAENGVDALMLAEGYPDRIDLLVTDVVMPRMSGQALSRALESMQSGVQTLFISGYTADEMRERGIWVPDRLITKPFTGDQLANEVRHVLDGEPVE